MVLAGLVALTLLFPQATITATAAGSGDRTLYLHHTHTGETGRFTFKRNGKYDPKVLRELDVFLADWRTKDRIKMDPALFDLLWAVYQEVGATQPINIVSSYRAPATNAMLRRTSSGVAENSQHMKGKAIDFFIPGIKLTVLREAVMRHQVGGIGYYPTSGSPFVHADTGNVRAWPRMTRAQLKKVFPDGRTLHLPTDGKPLSQDGRAYAQAQWNECHAVPCSGNSALGGPAIMLASLGEKAPIPAIRPSWLGDAARPVVQLASIGGDPVQRVVPTIDIPAPVPALRPSMTPGGVTAEGAPIPAQKSQRIAVAMLATPPSGTQTALAALDTIGKPAARTQAAAPRPEVVAAYVGNPEPGAQEALRMIIERETATPPKRAMVARASAPDADDLQTASIGGDGLKQLRGMFDLTFNALRQTTAPAPVATALADLVESRLPNPSIAAREIELVAPELDHVNETLVMPVFMSGEHFAVMTEAEGYLDKSTELGPLTGRIGFHPEPTATPAYDQFVPSAPLLVASR